jgi:hypothetical protein
MPRSAGAMCRILLACFLCVLVAPYTAHAAERSVVADFDGDGYHDRATLDGREPSVLRVWLSTTRTTAIVRSRSPLVGIAARDLDGDRRAELLAGAGAPATGLQVWTRRHAAFSRFQPRPVPTATFSRPVRHNVHDAPGGLPLAVASAAPWLAALSLAPQPRAPAPAAAALVIRRADAPPPPPNLSPLAPRPPPVSR